MIFRLLILFLVVWFLIWLIKKQFTKSSSATTPPDDQSGEDMIACDYCGAHAPKSLVVSHQGKRYCCEEHAESDANRDR